MKQPVVIIGMGEMGSVFARALLKTGHPVFPLRRQDDMNQAADHIDNPELVLLAVAENDLQTALDQLPENWRDKVVRLQNELLPRDWQDKNLIDPTVISVWFEKKPGMDYKVLIPSPVQGPKAQLIHNALATLNIPVQIIDNENDMLFELVRKNMYILTTNICGLESGGNVKQLWDDNSILLNKVFDDVLEVQQHLTGHIFNRDHMLNAVLTAFDGDPEHQCMGRSAPQRLQRALLMSQEGKLQTPELERIKALN